MRSGKQRKFYAKYASSRCDRQTKMLFFCGGLFEPFIVLRTTLNAMNVIATYATPRNDHHPHSTDYVKV